MRRLLPLALLIATLPVQAGLFSDDEARAGINALRTETNTRFDNTAKAQVDLTNQIETLKTEVSRLRGQIETLTYELQQTQKRQQDFYLDLDTRLRKMEPQAGAEKKDAAPKVDAAAEARDYEAAFALLKGGKYKEAQAALEHFMSVYGEGQLAPNAQYWLGNVHYAQRNCKKAIDMQQVVVNKWPEHAKTPDALLAIATCQDELGQPKQVKQTLDTIIVAYPKSPAAETAKQRLAKLAPAKKK